MTTLGLLAVMLVVGLIYAVTDRVLTHRERTIRERTDAAIRAGGELYDAGTVVLCMRAAAYRAADPQMGDELVERIVQTVAEDLDAGTLSDPRPAA